MGLGLTIHTMGGHDPGFMGLLGGLEAVLVMLWAQNLAHRMHTLSAGGWGVLGRGGGAMAGSDWAGWWGVSGSPTPLDCRDPICAGTEPLTLREPTPQASTLTATHPTVTLC